MPYLDDQLLNQVTESHRQQVEDAASTVTSPTQYAQRNAPTSPIRPTAACSAGGRSAGT
jgi:hypothetical protein